jgi:ABC-type arginine/histidine transport system permease subunit
MNPSRQPIPKWQIAAMACLAAAWIALTTPLVLGRGDVDAFFLRTFKAYSRSSHPYLSLTPLFLQLWLAYTCLLMFSSVAIARRKADLFTVLCVGPALACGVAAMAVSWSDPNWLLVSGVCLIGCAVGLVSGAGYCAYTSFMGKVEPSDAADSR